MNRVKWVLLPVFAVGAALALLIVVGLGTFTRPSSAAGEASVTKVAQARGEVNDFLPNDGRDLVQHGNCNAGNCVDVLQGQTGDYRAFGFAIPCLEATIKGIQVTVGTSDGTLADQAQLQLFKNDGSDVQQLVGDVKSVSVPGGSGYSQLTTPSIVNDLWNASLNAEAINNSIFGVRIQDSSDGDNWRLDYVSITVHYDDDDDDDGSSNCVDNCRYDPNPDQTNTDVFLADNGARIGLPDGGGVIPPLVGDALGDACDDDDDNDTYPDAVEDVIGTNRLDNCYGEPFSAPPGMDQLVANDAWPPDLNTDKRVITTTNATNSDNDYIQGNILRLADTQGRARLNARNTFTPAITVADGGDGLNAGQTTVGYQSTGDPIGINAVIRIDSEWMLVTAVNTSTDVLTVTRGHAHTIASTHAEGATIHEVLINVLDVIDLWVGKGDWRCN